MAHTPALRHQSQGPGLLLRTSFLSTWCAHFPLPIMEFFVTFLLLCQSAEVWTPDVPTAEGNLSGKPEAS